MPQAGWFWFIPPLPSSSYLTSLWITAAVPDDVLLVLFLTELSQMLCKGRESCLQESWTDDPRQNVHSWGWQCKVDKWTVCPLSSYFCLCLCFTFLVFIWCSDAATCRYKSAMIFRDSPFDSQLPRLQFLVWFFLAGVLHISLWTNYQILICVYTYMPISLSQCKVQLGCEMNKTC